MNKRMKRLKILFSKFLLILLIIIKNSFSSHARSKVCFKDRKCNTFLIDLFIYLVYLFKDQDFKTSQIWEWFKLNSLKTYSINFTFLVFFDHGDAFNLKIGRPKVIALIKYNYSNIYSRVKFQVLQ